MVYNCIIVFTSAYYFYLNIVRSSGGGIQVPRLARDKRGAQNVIGAIIAILALLFMACLILGYFQQQTDTQIANLNDTTVQNTYSNIKSAGWGVLNLMGMYPWAMGAVAILGVIGLLARGR